MQAHLGERHHSTGTVTVLPFIELCRELQAAVSTFPAYFWFLVRGPIDSFRGRSNTYLYYRGSPMAMNVRLSASTERAVNALARRRRQTRSDVVRDALEHYTATNGGDASRGRPYDAWLDVIGVVSSPGNSAGKATVEVRTAVRDRRKTTGERFTAIVREKARARRPR
jgi:hypothetical protein